MTKSSVHRAPYLRNHTLYDHHLWYTCVKGWFLQAFFSFFHNFNFLGCYWIKRARNDPDWQKIVSVALHFRVFQIVVWDGGKSPPKKIFLREIFYSVMKTWGGVILTIWTFFKAKKQHSVNTEHKLKSKLAWPVCQKSMKLK